jgi:coenzyme PQQ precursor peptide PqqA
MRLASAERAGAAECCGIGRTGVLLFHPRWRMTMQWTTPSYTDMRFGFEITMYIATR